MEVFGLLVLVLVCLGFRPASASEAIELAPGDTLDFSVIGAPQLARTVVVSEDGTIFIPIAGEVRAAGFSIRELRNELVQNLSDRTFRMVAGGGDEVWSRIRSEDIYLEVLAYQPVYVSGSVRSPGEIAYRPGMKVRHLLAAAGGVGIAVAEEGDRDIARWERDRIRLIRQIEQQRSNLAVLEMELQSIASEETATGDSGSGSAEASSDGRELDEFSERWLGARRELRAANFDANQLVLEQLKNRLQVLEEMQRASEETRIFDEELLQRAQDLVARGVRPASSVIEAQQGLLQSSTRSLETAGEVLRLRLEIARVTEQGRSRLLEERLTLLEQIADVSANLDDLKNELYVNDSYFSPGLQLSASGPAAPTIELRLYRRSSVGEVKTTATQDMLILPGDLLEVAVSSIVEDG